SPIIGESRGDRPVVGIAAEIVGAVGLHQRAVALHVGSRRPASQPRAVVARESPDRVAERELDMVETVVRAGPVAISLAIADRRLARALRACSVGLEVR